MHIRLALGLLVAIALVPPPARAATGWRWPVRGPIADAYRYREATPFLAGQRRGIVIAAPTGAAVRAACAGRVSFAGRAGPAGRGVSVACGALTATYTRLDEVAVRRGQHIEVGDALGRLGGRGLHLGARLRRVGHVCGAHQRAALRAADATNDYLRAGQDWQQSDES